jgi:hypothetical protein
MVDKGLTEDSTYDKPTKQAGTKEELAAKGFVAAGDGEVLLESCCYRWLCCC